MIRQYRFALTGTEPLRIWDGYRLYSWLLENLPEEFGDLLHQQSLTPIAQYLLPEPDRAVWTVSLLGDYAVESASALLEALPPVTLHTDHYQAALLGCTELASVQAVLHAADALPEENRVTLQLRTPTAFKQNGRYVIFPQERLILQSLMAKWDAAFPECPLQDPDALEMLARGLRICDYRLRSARYGLKGNRIPGFCGELTLEANLSAPMRQLWNCLCILAPYSGIGIKTALGMGGVCRVTVPPQT